jgi:hypothetical protein
MPEAIEITVKNKLILEKRDLSVYHHASRSAHIISPGSSVSLLLGACEKNDYLHISAIKGPGNLVKNCLANIPARFDFEFKTRVETSSICLNHRHNREDNRTLLTIPPGPPAWELKITRPARDEVGSRIMKGGETVIIEDPVP